MSEKNDAFIKDMEGLFKKGMEINTHYLKEGTSLVSKMTKLGSKGGDLNFLKPETVASAFTAFAKLNLDHYNNVLDLGLQLTKRAVSVSEEDATHETPNTGNQVDEPAFILTADLEPGSKTSLGFLLDNTKEDEVTCQLRNTDFSFEDSTDKVNTFHTEFSPQSFLLAPGQSQEVKIEIGTSPETEPGNYTSRVQVIGFEPAYFLIKLNVHPLKNTGNGRGKPKK